jgi:hypothetical protein
MTQSEQLQGLILQELREIKHGLTEPALRFRLERQMPLVTKGAVLESLAQLVDEHQVDRNEESDEELAARCDWNIGMSILGIRTRKTRYAATIDLGTV